MQIATQAGDHPENQGCCPEAHRPYDAGAGAPVGMKSEDHRRQEADGIKTSGKDRDFNNVTRWIESHHRPDCCDADDKAPRPAEFR